MLIKQTLSKQNTKSVVDQEMTIKFINKNIIFFSELLQIHKKLTSKPKKK